jgi:hypothetical protein
MPRRIVFGLILLAGAALAWAGNDPWKSKPYQQWDSKDVERIMDDSPWAKMIRVDVLWKNAAPNQSDADTKDLGGGGGGGDDSDKSSHPSALRQPGEGTQFPQTVYLTRWISSRTMRAAVLRNAVLGGNLKEDAADKQLAAPVDAYQVELLGRDMTPFQGMDEKALTQAAYLQTKKKKEKISPAKIEIARSKDGKTIQAIEFLFPKKGATGESTIAADEKGVDFYCTAGKAKIQTSFEIPKMEDMKGRDL